jgi:NAD(P)-dependent dehydrogenase (short-subunit alcohol dehydrogenase family)
MSKKLAGKVAVITGGASGIGRAVAHQFLQEGAKVALLDIATKFQDDRFEAYSSNLLFLRGDVTKIEDQTEALNKVLDAFGRVDVYVSNAGVFDGFVSLAELPDDRLDEAFELIFNVNVKGGLLGAKVFYPELKKNKGNIIFTLSNAAFYPNGGGPIYTASKHALVGLVRQLAFELAPEVRVNGVSPGGTLTKLSVIPPLRDVAKVTGDPSKREHFIRQRNPLKIAQLPEDHAAAYVLLASEGGRAMTGTIIESDGGIGVRGMPLSD